MLIFFFLAFTPNEQFWLSHNAGQSINPAFIMEAPRVMVAGGPELPWCDEERLVRKAERGRTEGGERREESQTVTEVTEGDRAQ